jgi:hypothetical protein
LVLGDSPYIFARFLLRSFPFYLQCAREFSGKKTQTKPTKVLD